MAGQTLMSSVLGQDESRLAGLTFVRLFHPLCFRDLGSGVFQVGGRQLSTLFLLKHISAILSHCGACGAVNNGFHCQRMQQVITQKCKSQAMKRRSQQKKKRT